MGLYIKGLRLPKKGRYTSFTVYSDGKVVYKFGGDPAGRAVEVIRCRECVHHVDCGYHFCNILCENCPDDGDFFCAYGERDGGVNDAAD